MKIKSLISIGSCCASLFFSKNLNLRIPGPVDNLLGDNILSSLKLLNGDFYTSIINNTYYFSNNNIWDKYEICNFNGFKMIHNDFHLYKTKNEMQKRYNNLQKYLEEAKTDKEMFFVLSYNNNDAYLSNNDMINLMNNIPQYIKNRLFIIGENNDKWNINIKNYPYIKNYPIYEVDISILRNFDKTILKNDFNNWWKINKYFYEDINKCTYDLL